MPHFVAHGTVDRRRLQTVADLNKLLLKESVFLLKVFNLRMPVRELVKNLMEVAIAFFNVELLLQVLRDSVHNCERPTSFVVSSVFGEHLSKVVE